MIRGKTRHQLFLPDAVSRRLAAMAKAQNKALSDLLLEAVDLWLNQRSAPQVDEQVAKRLDRIARAVDAGNREAFIISHTLHRFARHQLIYAAALPAPGEDAKALGEKRYQAFIDSVARTLAKGVDEGEPVAGSSVERAARSTG
jgi:hypothetical protein